MNWRAILSVGVLCISVILPPVFVAGAIITVRQDGSGDHTTINDAISAATALDTIDVGPGTYCESIEISKRLIIFGSSGKDVTIVDGEGSRRLMAFLGGSCGSSIFGFTFTNGFSYNGGALRVQDGCELHVADCLFENNTAEYDGGAFFARHSGTHLMIEECSFIGNSSGHNGGAGNIIEPGLLEVIGCVFEDNSTYTRSAGLAAHGGASMNVTGCLFTGNMSGDLAGGLYYYYSTGTVENNTFHGNTSPGDNAATVYIHNSPDVDVLKNIFTNETAMFGLWDDNSYFDHTCNVFWANAMGSIGGGSTLDPSEVVADPLYCNAAGGDFTIAFESPAAPANNSCGVLIGAFDPACHREPINVEPVIESIADIPNDQGRRVRIVWTRSIHDSHASPITITTYGIYRREAGWMAGESLEPQGEAVETLPSENKPGIVRETMLRGWDFIATVPARGDSAYQMVVTTLCDSTINDGMCWSVFFVSAMTEDPLTYWDSTPDSGYSVDNRAPCAPSYFAAEQSGGDMLLTWEENTEPDFECCRLWKTEVPGSQEARLLAETAETSFLDTSWEPGEQAIYTLEAIDANGNRSEPTILMPDDFIATLLQQYSASRNDDGIVVSWTLAEDSDEPGFTLFRNTGGKGYIVLEEAIIERSGQTYKYIDRDITPGESYRYRVAYDFGPATFVLFETDAVSIPVMPLTLFQNYPNPFNPATEIKFFLPGPTDVRLEIFDIAGRRIAMIANMAMSAGTKTVRWDGTDAQGQKVTSGTYFYRLKAGNKTVSRKMILLR